jgi:hypothetical protein
VGALPPDEPPSWPPEAADDGSLTPARFLAEFLAGFQAAGPRGEAGLSREPMLGGLLPTDLASAGRLVSGLRTRAERSVQRLLAERAAAAPPLAPGEEGPASEAPVVVDAAFLREHGLALLAGLVEGPPSLPEDGSTAPGLSSGSAPGSSGLSSGSAPGSSGRSYRPYRLDLVSVAAEGLTWASGVGEGLAQQLGLRVPDVGRLVPEEVRALLPGSLGDLVGAATGLLAGLIEEAREGAAPGLTEGPEDAVAIGWTLDEDDGDAGDELERLDAQEAADERE